MEDATLPRRQVGGVPRQLRHYLSAYKRAKRDSSGDSDDVGLGATSAEDSTSLTISSTIKTLAKLPSEKLRRSRPRRHDKLRHEKVKTDGDCDSDDDEHNSTSTQTSTSTSKATSKPITLATSSSSTISTGQAGSVPLRNSGVSSGNEISSANEISQQQAHNKTTDGALLGAIFAVLGGAFLAFMVVVAINYRRKRLSRQNSSENDQNLASKQRDPGSDQGSVIWGGSVVNTEYRPPVPAKNSWYPATVRSVGDRVSRLWGGSQISNQVPRTEADQNEKTDVLQPAMPEIPPAFRIANGHPILSADFSAPPAAYLPSDTSSVRAERLDRVRDDLPSRAVSNRDSVPRFRTAESWVADQTFRLQQQQGR